MMVSLLLTHYVTETDREHDPLASISQARELQASTTTLDLIWYWVENYSFDCSRQVFYQPSYNPMV